MNGAKILVVEDKQTWREKLRQILERAGYTVETAVDYGEALGRLRHGACNLIVVDLKLGPKELPEHFAGMALLEDAYQKGIPTIVVTGYPSVERIRRAYEDYDVRYFLSKQNFEVARFKEIIRQVLPPMSRTAYNNFDLGIEPWRAEGYPLHANSPQGQARGWLKLAPTSEPVQSYLERLATRATDESFLIEFGVFLYTALFTGDIASLLQRSLGAVMGRENQGLRIRLRIDPPEISALPWEYLYLAEQRYFLGASKKTPLTRHLEVALPIPSLQAALPLKVLAVIPRGSGLDVQQEKDVLTEALSKLGDAVRLEFLEGQVTRSAVADALSDKRYHVFHFIGHGVFENERGYLIFNDESGGRDKIGDDIFARFFLNEPSIKLVVLNACQGAMVSSSRPMVGLAPRLVERGIPAVVAYQYSVTDQVAICFAHEFYRSLCLTGQVDVAVAHARNQLSIRFSTERSLGAPVLFMRSPDGLIFDLTP